MSGTVYPCRCVVCVCTFKSDNRERPLCRHCRQNFHRQMRRPAA